MSKGGEIQKLGTLVCGGSGDTLEKREKRTGGPLGLGGFNGWDRGGGTDYLPNSTINSVICQNGGRGKSHWQRASGVPRVGFSRGGSVRWGGVPWVSKRRDNQSRRSEKKRVKRKGGGELNEENESSCLQSCLGRKRE